jgi:hypothetical protein
VDGWQNLSSGWMLAAVSWEAAFRLEGGWLKWYGYSFGVEDLFCSEGAFYSACGWLAELFSSGTRYHNASGTLF